MTLRRRGLRRFVGGSNAWILGRPRQSRGPRHVAESGPRLDVIYELELLAEALAEAEDAARWYAERSSSIAFDFTEHVDAAVAQILQAPFAWPPHERQTRRFVL